MGLLARWRARHRPPAPVYADDGSLPVLVVAADPARADSAVLAEAAGAGLDLTVPLLVRHHLVLPDLDAARHEAAWDGTPLSLTATEFALLRTLSARPGMVFSRGQLMDAAYEGNIHVSDRTIDSHVRHLRGKLAEAGGEGAIETVHGVGFKLGACEG